MHSLEIIRNLLIEYQKDAFLVEMALNVVVALTMNGEQLISTILCKICFVCYTNFYLEKLIIQEEIETDMTSAILLGLENHLDSPNIVRSACLALSSLINYLGIEYGS